MIPGIPGIFFYKIIYIPKKRAEVDTSARINPYPMKTM